MSGESALVKRIVQFAHSCVSLFVCGVLWIKADSRLPEHERERTNMPRKFRQREMMRFKFPACEEWQTSLFFGFEIIKNEPCKIRDENVTRYLMPSLLTREIFDVFESL